MVFFFKWFLCRFESILPNVSAEEGGGRLRVVAYAHALISCKMSTNPCKFCIKNASFVLFLQMTSILRAKIVKERHKIEMKGGTLFFLIAGIKPHH